MSKTVRYSILISMLVFAFALTGAEQPAVFNAKTATHPQALQRAGEVMAAREAQLVSVLTRGLEGAAVQRHLQDQMQAVMQPENLIPHFVKTLRHHPGVTNSAALQRNLSAPALPMGTISGTVTVDGGVPDPSYEIVVIAFDAHGYYMGHDDRAAANAGNYQIKNLPAGDYYVLTSSNRYVDKIYNNLHSPLDQPQTWRMAEKVRVEANATAAGINFDLQKGAVITGFIAGEDGFTFIQDMDIHFIVTSADAPHEIFTTTYYTIDGFYDLVVPLKGAIKVAAFVDGFLPVWYNNQADWSAATPLTISRFDTLIAGVDFYLPVDPEKALLGGISGNFRYSDEYVPPITSFATVFVFDAADSSLAGWTLGIGGSYTIENLKPGEYFVYLDDALGNLIGLKNYMGQYWENANTPAGAKTVTVQPGEIFYGIDFVLEPGGSVSGTITAGDGAKLDGVWVLAIHASLVEGELQPLLANLNIFIGRADEQGHYRINGMPSGSYVLRTVSDSLINQKMGSLVITSGRHSGKVVDQWFGGDASLFSIATAQPVPVAAPAVTRGVDFVLEKAKYISGRITDSVSGIGLSFYNGVYALDDTSGIPFLSFSMFTSKKDQIDPLGNYSIGPLPSGTYKVLAVAPLSGPNNYLSEFYSDAYTFDTAQTVTIGASDLNGIDFTVHQAAAIQGFVDLPAAGGVTRAGADVLDNFPILVYEATTGKLASMDYVQFSGGYRVDHLLPGQYKVLALPCVPQVAATYYGGGDTWEDPAAQIVILDYGTVADCDILLEPAVNTISGTVKDAETLQGLTQVMVIAYDPSGHPVGMAMSNFDMVTGNVVEQDGAFLIPGLRAGAYHLRTFALSMAFGLSDQILSVVGMIDGGGTDLMGDLMGGELGGLTGLFSLDFDLYADQWHHRAAAHMAFDLQSLVINLLTYGLPSGYDNAVFPVFLPLPMAESVPAGAALVTVQEGSGASGIAFLLTKTSLDDYLNTAVETREVQIPEAFTVLPNYPNPFNPETTLRFATPHAGPVQIVVYDALGRQVRALLDGYLPAGVHVTRWDGRNDRGEIAPSGLYLARFSASGEHKIVKMVLMK